MLHLEMSEQILYSIDVVNSRPQTKSRPPPVFVNFCGNTVTCICSGIIYGHFDLWETAWCAKSKIHI